MKKDTQMHKLIYYKSIRETAYNASILIDKNSIILFMRAPKSFAQWHTRSSC